MVNSILIHFLNPYTRYTNTNINILYYSLYFYDVNKNVQIFTIESLYDYDTQFLIIIYIYSKNAKLCIQDIHATVSYIFIFE